HHELRSNARPVGRENHTEPDTYQVWGYTSLNNYLISLRVRALYLPARDQLALYYQHKGLGLDDSMLAAKLALLASAPGSTCGGGVPANSLRRMLLERAPLHDIEPQLSNIDSGAPEIYACAKYAGLDPVLLVAIGDPVVFPRVLKVVPDINVRNTIGKTALMEAAQFDQRGMVNLLLAKHARVNAATWDHVDQFDLLNNHGRTLGNDARTALMYAAANGSLDLVKALLDAGADPYQADTKGYRAIDYLLGYGPMPPNTHLSERQRKQAAHWLF
ncbi:MAG: ankyrin repeat domain-containing protein, partial [Rhodanobacter sp.]